LGKKIIIFSNRTILHDQISNEISDKEISVINYQNLESHFEGTRIAKMEKAALDSLIEYLAVYDYIVLDEAHYIYQDATFNRYTDVILKAIQNLKSTKTIIMMTATADILLGKFEFQEKYNFVSKYDAINGAYAYTNYDCVYQIIGNALEHSEKVMFFGNSKQRLIELQHHYNTLSEFVCADNKDSSTAISQIIAENKFDTQILFTTKVLDNGVSIHDRQLKRIIIEMSDMTDFLQCLGRKRVIDAEDTYTLYFLDYGKRLNSKCATLKRELEIYAEWCSSLPFVFHEKYLREKRPNFLDGDENIIDTVLKKKQYDYEFCSQIVSSKKTFVEIVEDKLNMRVTRFEKVQKDMRLVDYLNRNAGKRLYKADRQMLFETFDIRHDYKLLKGLDIFNEYLRAGNFHYHIEAKKSDGKRYWIITQNT
jgi:hypothetical protein